MTRLAHLIATDLRRHRLLLLAWVAVVVLASTLKGVNPVLDGNVALRSTMGLVATLLELTQFLLAALLVPLVIQTHALVGSTAFWMTRPIPPVSLLASKALLLSGAIVVLPVLAEIGVMAAYHVPADQMLAVSVQATASSCFWLMVAAVLAALTPTLAGFALVCGGLLLSGVVALAATAAIAFAMLDESVQTARMLQAPDPTAGIVLLILATASGIVLLVALYRSRARLRSIAVGGAALLLAFVVASAWPWAWLAPRLDEATWAAVPGSARLVADPQTVKLAEPTNSFGRSRWRAVRAGLFLDRMPPGWTAQAGLVEATLRVAGRSPLVSAPWGTVPLADGERKFIREVAAHVLGVERLADVNPRAPDPAVVINAREPELRELAPAVGVYRGLFQILPIRHEIDVQMPLRAGAVHQRGAWRLVIEKVEYAAGEVSVEVRESDAFSVLNRRLRPEHTYYLRNRHRSEAVEGNAEPPRYMWLPLPFGIAFEFGREVSGFVAQRVTVGFPSRQIAQAPPFSLDERWLEGAELVVVSATQARAFDRTLEISQFPLPVSDAGTTPTDGKGGAGR